MLVKWYSAAMLALLGIVALTLAAGCGPSAKSDLDLNTGEFAASEDDSSAVARALFDDPWLFGTSENGGWEYTISEGDVLEVAFFTHPEQNRHVTVRPDGVISLPHVGEVRAAGRSSTDLAEELRERYSDVLVTPEVDVIVQEMGARYYVIGNVIGGGGEYTYERPVTLLQALARAGGYNESARLSSLVLLRRTDDGRGAAAILNMRTMMDSDSKLGDIRIRPYDIVWVPMDNLSRWDNAASKSLGTAIDAMDVVIKGWGLVNWTDVYENRGFRP